MALDLGSASARLTLDANEFIRNAQSAGDAMQDLQSRTDSVSSGGGFVNWVNNNEQALNRWGKGLLAVGGLITSAFTVPIIGGTKAAWGYADSMQQSSVMMNAYVDDAEDVDRIMANLVEYSTSERSGGLFFVNELAEATSSMLIYGASADEVTEYTEILSRSVGIGAGNWQELNRIVGRVGSTGRMTGDDFDMLTKMGYDLDESIRNTNMTWGELFEHLDQGIPADALVGQAGTIRAGMAWLQGAVLNLGAEFLGLNTATGEFMEGGLGWQMMRGIERLTDLMNAAAPAVGRIGSMFASLGTPIGRAIDLLIRLPQPIQTAMVLFTGALGAVSLFSGGLLLMLPRIASTVAAFQQLGGLTGILGGLTSGVRVLGTTMWAAFAPALPVIIAVGAAIAALSAAFYVLYQSNFLGFADFVDGAIEKVQILIQGIQQAFGTPHHNTGDFEIHTTADNVWDDWQQQPDGSWKNADLDISSTTDDGAFEYMGYDEETGKWVVMYITSEGEIPGEIVDSSRNPNNPTQYFWTIDLDDGGTVAAVYDEVTGTIEILEGPNEFNVDAGKAYHELEGVEKMAADVGLAFWAAEEMAKAFWDMVTTPIDLAINALRILDDKIGDIGDAWDGVTYKIETAWEAIEITASGIIEGIQTLVDAVVSSIESTVESAITGINALITLANRIPGIDIDTVGDDSGQDGSSDSGGNGSGVTRTPKDAREYQDPITFGAGFGLGSYFRDSADAAGLFGNALSVLTPEIMRSNDSLNTTASTVPMYTSATQDADQATGAMASGMGTSFNSMASSAMSNFSTMESEASGKTSAMNSLVSSQTSSMQSSVISNLLGMRSSAVAQASGMQSNVTGAVAGMRANAASQASGMQSAVTGSMLGMRANSASQLAMLTSSANSQTSNMRSYATTNASNMQSSVAGSILGMRTASALQMGLMASSARTSGSQMDTGMTGWMTGARVRIAASMAGFVSTVRNTGGAGYDAGHYAGSQISRGFANGMNAYLGSIRASASAMVAAASAAVIARAMISSPSRLFEGYGKYIGEGLEVGILKSIPDIDRAAGRMLNASVPSPALSTPIGGSHGGTQYIDNSTHTTEYIALTESDFQQLLRKSERGNAAWLRQTDPDAFDYGSGI